LKKGGTAQTTPSKVHNPANRVLSKRGTGKENSRRKEIWKPSNTGFPLLQERAGGRTRPETRIRKNTGGEGGDPEAKQTKGGDKIQVLRGQNLKGGFGKRRWGGRRVTKKGKRKKKRKNNTPCEAVVARTTDQERKKKGKKKGERGKKKQWASVFSLHQGCGNQKYTTLKGENKQPLNEKEKM